MRFELALATSPCTGRPSPFLPAGRPDISNPPIPMLKNKLSVRIPNTGDVLDIPMRPAMTARDLIAETAIRLPELKHLDCAFSGTRPLAQDELVGDTEDLAVSTRFVAG